MRNVCNCETCKERRKFSDYQKESTQKIMDTVFQATPEQIKKLADDIFEVYKIDDAGGMKFEDFKVTSDEGHVSLGAGSINPYPYSSVPFPDFWITKMAAKDEELAKLKAELEHKNMLILSLRAALKGVLSE